MPTGPRPQPPVGTARVVLSGHVSGHKFVNVMWLLITHTDPITIADLNSIATAIGNAWNTDFAPLVTSNVTLDNVAITFIPSAGQSLETVVATSHTGSDSNVLNDASACYVIDWKIGDFYRGGHPRTYLPGPRANHIVNASDLDASTLSSMATNAQNFLNAVNAITSTHATSVQLGTVRFESGKAWLSPPVFKAFLAPAIRSVLGSQRRRLKA